jgi:hypothetical protein
MMTPAILFTAMLCLAADSPTLLATAEVAAATVAFEFKDAAVYENRPILQFRAIEFRTTLAKPLAEERKFPEGAQYGLVLVGANRDTALSIVWNPKAEGGPELWLDANADGKLADDERHAMTGRDLEIPVSFQLQIDPPSLAERTLLIRRSSVGDGLRYAVRGYAQGRLKLREKEYAVLLIDGNADGRFDTIGQDRVWIDLNEDGRFDALTEQYPLGKPILRGKDVFVISSDAKATAVAARLRSEGQGKIRLTLGRKVDPKTKIAAELVSDLGELVIVDKLAEGISVPFGKYRLSSLKLEVPDAGGQTWTYNFDIEKNKYFNVPTGQEAAVVLLEQFAMNVSLGLENGKALPGQTLSIQPKLTADGWLSLNACKIGKENDYRQAEGNAEILLAKEDGTVVNRGLTGFS